MRRRIVPPPDLRAGMTPRDLAAPLARHCMALAPTVAPTLAHPLLVGLCGAQGSGKSTLAAGWVAALATAGRRAVSLSLDDFYLGRAARARLAATVHPLFSTRGVPGTHDLGLGQACITALLSATGPVMVPRFDKASDDCGAAVTVTAPVDVVILEGWCVGAMPQSPAALLAPANALEAEADPAGIWRRAANTALATDYAALWQRLDLLVALQAPDWRVVAGWRAEQEARLGERAMSATALTRFVAHYERLTRHMLAGGIGRRGRPADITVALDEARGIVAITGLEAPLA